MNDSKRPLSRILLPGLIIAGLGLYFLYAGTIGAGNSIYGFTWVNTTNIDATNYYYDGVNYTQFIIDLIPGAGGGVFDQDLNTTDAVTFVSLDTGQGANELYDMNQNVLTTSSVTFDDVTITDELSLGGVAITSWDEVNITGSGGSGDDTRIATIVIAAYNTVNKSLADPGYICDGDADDVTIQRAVDKIISSGLGGKVVLLEGDFNITSAILIQGTNRFVLEGMGMTSSRLVVDTQSPDINVIYIGSRTNVSLCCKDITIRDLMINGSAQTAETALTPEAQDRRMGIVFSSPTHQTTDIIIEHCYLYETGSDSIYGYIAGRYIISNCVVNGTRGYWGGIHCHGAFNEGQVIGNIVINCDVSGIRHSKIIMGNYVIDCGLSGDTSGREACIVGSYDCEIIGNYVDPPYASGIIGIKTFNRNNHVVENTIGLCVDSAITLAGYDSHVVKGNNFYDVWTGIKIDNSDSNLITGNNFDRCRTAIQVMGSLHNTISENVIRNSNKDNGGLSAILLETNDAKNSIYNMIIDNHIYSEIANKPVYGIYEEDADQDYNYYHGNRIFDTTTSLVNIQGLNSILSSHEIQFVYGTAYSVSAPYGWDVDAGSEYAIATGAIPDDLQQVIRIKIYAVANVTEADSMSLTINGYSGPDNSAYNTESINLVNQGSTSVNFAQYDVIVWTLTPSDDADIDDILTSYLFMLQVEHNVAYGDDCATDAVFTCVVIEYV